jgi:hypothetical protein
VTSYLLPLLQGAVEYGALAGSAAARRLGRQSLVAWASDHALLLLGGAAVVLLLGLLTRGRRP